MLGTLPYYALLLIAGVPAMTQRGTSRGLGWAAFFLLVVLFVGLRYQVGSDWEGYLELADLVRGARLSDLPGEDPLFFLVLWSSVEAGLEVYGANLVTSGIFLLGVFYYCGRMPTPWLALYSALPFLVIVVGMSANRQAAAIGVTLLLLARWEKSSLVSRIALLLLATGFHASAAIFGLLFVIDSQASTVKKVLASSVVLTGMAYYLASSTSLDRYTESYVSDPQLNIAAGALQQILLNALPALLLASSKKLRAAIPQRPFVLCMALLALLLVPLALTYSVAASRLSFYLFPVSITVCSALPCVPRNPKNRLTLKYAVLLYGAAILFMWLNFANHAENHNPYGNFLFL